MVGLRLHARGWCGGRALQWRRRTGAGLQLYQHSTGGPTAVMGDRVRQQELGGGGGGGGGCWNENECPYPFLIL